MTKEKDYVDKAMEHMMDSLAQQAEDVRAREIAIKAGICMHCGTSAKGGQCLDEFGGPVYQCWIR